MDPFVVTFGAMVLVLASCFGGFLVAYASTRAWLKEYRADLEEYNDALDKWEDEVEQRERQVEARENDR